jgi:hypothetical protein
MPVPSVLPAPARSDMLDQGGVGVRGGLSPMRRTLAVLVVAATAVAAGSCSSTTTRSVTGSGRMATRELPVTAVHRILAGSFFRVSVSMGSRDAVTLRYDDNLGPYLDIGTVGETLRLQARSDVSLNDVTLEAKVTARSLSEVRASGLAEVSVQGSMADSPFSLDVSGAARFAGEWASGTAQVTLSGTARHLGLSGSGASHVEAPDLVVDALAADLSGATWARVHVSDSIEATLSGASSLRYTGDPDIVRQEVSGASSLTRG